MGYANFNENGDLVWNKVFLCPQIVSSAEVDFEELGGDAFAVEKAIADGVLNDPSFVWVSWHSHAKMSAYWSKTDDDRIAALREAGIQHVVSFVGNHDRKYKARFDVFDINRGPYSIPHVVMNDLKVFLDPDDPIFEECDREYNEHVVTIKYQTLVGSSVKSVISPQVASRLASESQAADSAAEQDDNDPLDHPLLRQQDLLLPG